MLKNFCLSKPVLRVPNKIVFLTLKIIFVLANSVEPDKMLHYVTLHLGLHYLLKSAFKSHYSI